MRKYDKKEQLRIEKEIKGKINNIIDELLAIDNLGKIKSIISVKMGMVNIEDKFNFENQLQFSHLSNIMSIFFELEDKPILFVKAGLREYKELDNPIIIDILNRIK